jgi:hypothetical protein
MSYSENAPGGGCCPRGWKKNSANVRRLTGKGPHGGWEWNYDCNTNRIHGGGLIGVGLVTADADGNVYSNIDINFSLVKLSKRGVPIWKWLAPKTFDNHGTPITLDFPSFGPSIITAMQWDDASGALYLGVSPPSDHFGDLSWGLLEIIPTLYKLDADGNVLWSVPTTSGIIDIRVNGDKLDCICPRKICFEAVLPPNISTQGYLVFAQYNISDGSQVDLGYSTNGVPTKEVALFEKLADETGATGNSASDDSGIYLAGLFGSGASIGTSFPPFFQGAQYAISIGDATGGSFSLTWNGITLPAITIDVTNPIHHAAGSNLYFNPGLDGLIKSHWGADYSFQCALSLGFGADPALPGFVNFNGRAAYDLETTPPIIFNNSLTGCTRPAGAFPIKDSGIPYYSAKKLHRDGSLAWKFRHGDKLQAIEVNADGEIYVSGYRATGVNVIDPSTHATIVDWSSYQPLASDRLNVRKLNSGGDVIWSRDLNPWGLSSGFSTPPTTDTGTRIAIDPSQNVVVGGGSSLLGLDQFAEDNTQNVVSWTPDGDRRWHFSHMKIVGDIEAKTDDYYYLSGVDASVRRVPNM